MPCGRAEAQFRIAIISFFRFRCWTGKIWDRRSFDKNSDWIPIVMALRILCGSSKLDKCCVEKISLFCGAAFWIVCMISSSTDSETEVIWVYAGEENIDIDYFDK
jgi:hypothetical protein